MKIRVSENISPLSLTHVDDIGKYLSSPATFWLMKFQLTAAFVTLLLGLYLYIDWSSRGFLIIEYTHMLVNHQGMFVL